MDYKKHYNTLIRNAQGKTINEYAEKHRIIPGCMGGTYEADNVVCLTPEEHYVAHQLLVKIYPTHIGLTQAAMYMTANRPGNKVYGWLRRKHAMAMSISQQGSKNSQHGTRWIHNLELRKCKKIKKDAMLPNNWTEGRKMKWNNIKTKFCKRCDNKFETATRANYCSISCRNTGINSKKKGKSELLDRREEFLTLYKIHGNLGGTLKAMGYVNAGGWHRFGKQIIEEIGAPGGI